jgi:hypothetical protein
MGTPIPALPLHVQPQVALDRLARHLVEHSEDPATAVLLSAVANKILVALGTDDVAQMRRLLELTARVVDGPANGKVVGVLARRAAGIVAFGAKMHSPPSYVRGLLSKLDPAFGSLSDDVLVAAFAKAPRSRSGALADLAHACDAFGFAGKSRRVVHQRLGKMVRRNET